MNSPKPKPLIPPPKVIELYKEMHAGIVKAEAALWQFLRHPTATEEQVAEAVRLYRSSYKNFREVRDSLASTLGK